MTYYILIIITVIVNSALIVDLWISVGVPVFNSFGYTYPEVEYHGNFLVLNKVLSYFNWRINKEWSFVFFFTIFLIYGMCNFFSILITRDLWNLEETSMREY